MSDDMYDSTRTCAQCGREIPYYYRSDAVYCGHPCRQAAYRARQAGNVTPKPADVEPEHPRVEYIQL